MSDARDPVRPAWRLVIDTATRRTTLALGDGPRLVVSRVREVGYRHGALLLELLDAALVEAGLRPADLAAIGVGTGPGSFTGLRVGLATAKTLAWSLGVPLVGVSTVDALRHAAGVGAGIPVEQIAVVLPAGARDHYVALPGRAPVLVPPDRSLDAAVAGYAVVAPDVAVGRLATTAGAAPGDDAHPGDALTHAAQLGLASALLVLADARLAAAPPDDVATLVPSYVALPRGITTPTEGMTWSPDPR